MNESLVPALDGALGRVAVARDHLIDVEQDAALEAAGYELHFTLDFSELFLYAYPLSFLADEFREPEDDPYDAGAQGRGLARQRMALTNGVREIRHPIVLLPPYANELRLHTAAVRNKLGEFASKAAVLNSLRRALAKVLRKRPNLGKVLEKVRAQKELTTDEKKLLRSVVARYFRDIWLVLTSSHGDLQQVMNLFRDNTVALLGRAFPGLSVSPDDDDFIVGAHAWFEKIERQPGRRNRPVQNATDADACQYLQMVNNRINPSGRALVLISHSFAVQQALKDASFVRLPGWTEPVRLVRGLRYLLTRLMCSTGGKVDVDRLAMQSATLKRASDEIEAAKGRSRRLVGSSIDIDEFRREMERVREIREQYRNIYEFLETPEAYAAELGRAAHEMRSFQQLGGIDGRVMALLIGNEDLRGFLAPSGRDMWIQVDEHLDGVRQLLRGDSSTETYIGILLRNERRQIPARIATDQLIYVPALLGLIRTEVRDDIRRLIVDATELTAQECNDAIGRLQRGCDRGDPQCGAALAIVWTYVGKWEAASERVTNALAAASVSGELYKELVLLWSVVERNVHRDRIPVEPRRALEQIARGGGDTRVAAELAMWEWLPEERRFIDEGSRSANYAAVAGVAIQRVEQALSIRRDDALRVFLLNKYAYLLAERNWAGDLERAQTLSGEIGKLIAHEQVSRGVERLEEHLAALVLEGAHLAYTDTQAVIKGRLAARGGAKAIDLRREAQTMLRNLVREGYRLLPWQRELISRHLDEVRGLGLSEESTDGTFTAGL